MMSRSAILTSLALAAGVGTVAGPALADCATAGLKVRCVYAGPKTTGTTRSEMGARFVTVGPSKADERSDAGHRVAAKQIAPRTDVLDPGDTLPGDVLILMNPLRYGLPRPQDGWTYFTLGRDIYRADIRSRRVLNWVNPHINRR